MSAAILVRLGDCCEIVSGATPKTAVAEYWGGDIAWATPKDLSSLDSKYIDTTPQKLTEAGYRSCSAKIMPAGSVLFSSRAPIGHVAINSVPMCTNQGFKSFVPDPKRVSPDYLYHWLRANKAYLQSLGNGATFKEVSKATVSEVRVPLPPLAEQRRIAAILDKADALRAKRREAIAKLDQLLQSVFLDMFGNPSRWPQVAIGEICDVKGGKRLPKGEDYATSETPFRYIRVSDIEMGCVREESLKYLRPEVQQKIQRYTVSKGDVIITIAGTIGVVAPVVATLHGANLTENAAKLVPKRHESYVPEFLSFAMSTSNAQAQIRSQTGQVTIGKLALFRIEKVVVPMPPTELQTRFSQIAEGIAKQKRLLLQSAEQESSLLASLQHRAFTGTL